MIGVQLERDVVTVGETVRASANWQHDATPVDLRVQLRWFTEGRGTVNSATVDEVVYTADIGPIPPWVEANLTVPRQGPASYDGSLIRIRWEVRAVLGVKWKVDPKASAPLLVRPFVIDDE